MTELPKSLELFRPVELKLIKKYLDDFFEIEKQPKDGQFNLVLPQIYEQQGINLNKYFTKTFLETFNGLMLENSQNINKVLGTVFLDRNVLKKIFQQGEKNVLLFSHHPAEDQTGGAGFAALSEEDLEKMKEMRISVYSLHSPLDQNNRISTARSLADGLNLTIVSDHSGMEDGFDGVVGELSKALPFDDFIQLVKDALENSQINFIQRKNSVKKVGVVPGGGTDPKMIIKAIELWCDTYLTGEYYNKLKIPLGDEERNIFNKIKDNLDINMIEGSHYSTERVVFVKELPKLFNDMGLAYQFIEQDDPWY